MQIPIIGVELSLNAAIVLATLLVASLLYLSNASGSPQSAKLDEDAFANLMEDTDGNGGWDDDGEPEKTKPTAAQANEAAAKLATAQKMMAAAAAKAKQGGAGAAGGTGTGMDTASALNAATPLPQKVNEGPYNIGDRVILQNMSDEALNGRHGIVADLWNKTTQEYPVDLDMFDPRNDGSIVAKPANLKKESEITSANKESTAPLNDKGCLLEKHGRAVSFICSSMRQSVANTVREQNPAKIANFCYQFWQTPNGKGVYPSLLKYLTQGILQQNDLSDLEKQLNPEEPRGAYVFVKDSLTDPRAVGSWHCRVTGDFWIIGGNADGTLLVPCNNTRQVYCVAGLRMPLAMQIMQMCQCPRPPKFHLTLLPWFGRLIHDPFIIPATGSEHVEIATPKQTAELMQAVRLATAEKRIVMSLNQLEVEGGSTEGIPYTPFVPKGGPPGGADKKDAAPKKEQEPATQAELALIDNVADFDPVDMTPTAQGTPPPMAAWNFVRAKGSTEETNPDREIVVVNAAGGQVDTMTVKDIAQPTATEILKKMLLIAAHKMEGKRCFILGVDDVDVFDRLQFLLKDTKNLRVVRIAVQRRPAPPGQAAE